MLAACDFGAGFLYKVFYGKGRNKVLSHAHCCSIVMGHWSPPCTCDGGIKENCEKLCKVSSVFDEILYLLFQMATQIVSQWNMPAIMTEILFLIGW